MKEVDERGVVRDACGSPAFERPGASTEAQPFLLFAGVAAG